MTSFLTPGDLSAIAKIRRDGFATRQAVADPPFDLTLYRANPTTDETEAIATYSDVVLSYRNIGADDRGSESAAAEYRRGSVEYWEPWDIAVGDVFALPGGETAEVVHVAGTHGGTVIAEFLARSGIAP